MRPRRRKRSQTRSALHRSHALRYLSCAVEDPDVLVDVELARRDAHAVRENTRCEAEHVPHALHRRHVALSIDPHERRQQRRLDGSGRIEERAAGGRAELGDSGPVGGGVSAHRVNDAIEHRHLGAADGNDDGSNRTATSFPSRTKIRVSSPTYRASTALSSTRLRSPVSNDFAQICARFQSGVTVENRSTVKSNCAAIGKKVRQAVRHFMASGSSCVNAWVCHLCRGRC